MRGGLILSLLVYAGLNNFCSVVSPPWTSTYEEREMIKGKLVAVLLAETDNSIRDLLAETVKIISEFEFPHRFAFNSK